MSDKRSSKPTRKHGYYYLDGIECSGNRFQFYAYNKDGEVQIHSWAIGHSAQMEWEIYQERLDDPRDPIVRVEVYREAKLPRDFGGLPLLPRAHWRLLPRVRPARCRE